MTFPGIYSRHSFAFLSCSSQFDIMALGAKDRWRKRSSYYNGHTSLNLGQSEGTSPSEEIWPSCKTTELLPATTRTAEDILSSEPTTETSAVATKGGCCRWDVVDKRSTQRGYRLILFRKWNLIGHLDFVRPPRHRYISII
ncbi:unnamed protein product [Nezara viridula]|uniref:Uncharacterized protein n=1 Tax=Nezara viridula TaxID=85310 RepID=A0A9P0HN12_NEZVI|nr:unnamed protein product [Nezara viridula]